MRELLSYSNHKDRPAAGQGSEGTARGLDEEEARRSQRQQDLASGKSYVPSQIQAHPAFLQTQREAPSRVGGIRGDLERIRAPVEGKQGPWGYPIDPIDPAPATPPPAAAAPQGDVPDYAREMVAKYQQLTEQHRAGMHFTEKEAVTPSISAWERQAVPDLAALNAEEARAWKLQREDVIAQTDRLRQAPEAPPYNLSETGLATVLDRIGKLRASARSMSPPQPQQAAAGRRVAEPPSPD